MSHVDEFTKTVCEMFDAVVVDERPFRAVRFRHEPRGNPAQQFADGGAPDANWTTQAAVTPVVADAGRAQKSRAAIRREFLRSQPSMFDQANEEDA